MSDARFNPPSAPVGDPHVAFSWLVAWVGASAATGTAYLGGLALSPILQRSFAAGTRTEGELHQAMFASPTFIFATFVLGVCGNVLGGYVSAEFSRAHPLRHAMAAGGICMVIGLVGYLGLIRSPFPLWVQVLDFAVTLPCVAAGARLWSYQRGSSVPGRADV